MFNSGVLYLGYNLKFTNEWMIVNDNVTATAITTTNTVTKTATVTTTEWNIISGLIIIIKFIAFQSRYI